MIKKVGKQFHFPPKWRIQFEHSKIAGQGLSAPLYCNPIFLCRNHLIFVRNPDNFSNRLEPFGFSKILDKIIGWRLPGLEDLLLVVSCCTVLRSTEVHFRIYDKITG